MMRTRFSVASEAATARLARAAIVLGGAVAVLVANAWHLRYLRLDDAYITFRYARNLAEGHGLVWNVNGPPTEGYTSTLHVFLLALGFRAGVNPELMAAALNLAAALATVAIVGLLLTRWHGTLSAALAPLLVLALYLVDELTAVHVAMGLETHVYVALLCASYGAAIAFVHRPSRRTAVLFAIAVWLSAMARPEGLLNGAVMYGVLGAHAWFTRAPDSGRVRLLLLSAAGALVLVGAWAGAKLLYNGYLLPNPFYVKSNQVSLAGLRAVVGWTGHLLWVLGPTALAGILVVGRRASLAFLRDPACLATLALTLAPPALLLVYYTTIIHEAGGGYRFTYPTFFFFVAGAAAVAAEAARRRPAVALVPLAGVALVLGVRADWHGGDTGVASFNEYHWRVARALASTGLRERATVIVDAAGIIPYASRFNQIDRVGLTDNMFSGRTPLSTEQREALLWTRDADVYIGHEPQAAPGSTGPSDDPVYQSDYVSRVLLNWKVPVAGRAFVNTPELVYGRMRHLRDQWVLAGEIAWPGNRLGLRCFAYVRKDSRHADVLAAALERLVAAPGPEPQPPVRTVSTPANEGGGAK